jgi:hypothetical protein
MEDVLPQFTVEAEKRIYDNALLLVEATIKPKARDIKSWN